MAGKSEPETTLVKKMRDAGTAEYGARLVTIKYHGSQFGEAGVSDLLMCLDGVFIAAEVKHPKNYANSVEKAEATGATIKQHAFIDRIIAAGGCGGVVASVEHFMDLLAVAEEQATGDRWWTDETGWTDEMGLRGANQKD